MYIYIYHRCDIYMSSFISIWYDIWVWGGDVQTPKSLSKYNNTVYIQILMVLRLILSFFPANAIQFLEKSFDKDLSL